MSRVTNLLIFGAVLTLVGLLGMLVSNHALAASIEKAELLNKHGLTADAKRELIDAIFDSKKSSTKAEAYYLLGKIAFAEKNTSAAADAWGTLISQYPKSEFAISAEELLPQLSDALNQESHELVENLKSRVYLRNADFWADGRDKIWKIDTIWLRPVEAAVKWYDKTINEFPKSEGARLAYIAKVRTLLGWEGYDDIQYGLKIPMLLGGFDKYMPELIQTLEDFQKDFPDEKHSHQAIRYQIAQVYWSNRQFEETREWLRRIIDADKTDDSFYRDLAERRLNGKLVY